MYLKKIKPDPRVTVGCRITPAFRDELKEQADVQGFTLSAYIEAILEEQINGIPHRIVLLERENAKLRVQLFAETQKCQELASDLEVEKIIYNDLFIQFKELGGRFSEQGQELADARRALEKIYGPIGKLGGRS
jgi:hypothetical protein